MFKIITVVGARPQFIKAAALNRVFKLKYSGKIQELILHTGQHYDQNMSGVFFDELELDPPTWNLEVGSAGHGKQTAEMMAALEEVFMKEKPDAVLVYGDTNSTLAGAIAASKIHIPLIHVEAGLRSFNKRMPEELNRILTDSCSTLLFCPTDTAVQNLEKEGYSLDKQGRADMNKPFVFKTGDIMLDNSLYYAKQAASKSTVLKDLGLEGKPFLLATIHRNTNTDDPKRLEKLLKSINELGRKAGLPVIAPLHPRTTKMIEAQKDLQELVLSGNIKIIPPAGYLDMCLLESASSLVVTDSGGVQKEAYFFNKPCLVLRPETEWVELLEHKTAILADADPDLIINGGLSLLNKVNAMKFPAVFGNGQASEEIADAIYEFLKG